MCGYRCTGSRRPLVRLVTSVEAAFDLVDRFPELSPEKLVVELVCGRPLGRRFQSEGRADALESSRAFGDAPFPVGHGLFGGGQEVGQFFLSQTEAFAGFGQLLRELHGRSINRNLA